MKQEWNVGELLSVSSAYWRGCTLQAGVRLDIFTIIGKNRLSIAQISKNAKTDERATEFLLNGLAAMGLLEKNEDLYSNSNITVNHLSKDSPHYMGHIILHHHHILDGWAQLDQAVKNGAPVEKRSYGAEAERESFLMGMFNLAMNLAPHIAQQIDLKGRKHLLDLGGGPGTYALHFCLANPDLKATIFDKPTTRPFAEKTIASFNLKDRFSFAGGDFNTDPITGGPYDVAWLSHILHSNGEKECQELIKKTKTQMSTGGLVIIHDFILNNTKDGPEFAALFSLNMLINNPRGRSYSEKEITSMMTGAGLNNITRHTFQSPNGSSILIGVV